MLLDDRPAYPMSCFYRLKLRGQFDAAVFAAALHETLTLHPLFTSTVTETKGQFHWHNTGTMPAISRHPLDEERQFPVSQGINLFHELPLKVAICNEQTEAVHLEGQTDIIFEVHHSASDAAGVFRFVEDLLCSYARRTGFANPQREAVDPNLLHRRGTFGRNRKKSEQFWGIFRAWKFLMSRIIPLTSKRPADVQKPPSAYPTIICQNLTEAETQNVQQKAKKLGITINDLFLCSAFFAMNNWQKQHFAERKRGSLRIAVPINLRTPAEERMPAANIVSMVFLNRRPEDIKPEPMFYQSVYKETQHIKRRNLGWAFIHGLTLYQRIFGSFRKMIRRERCWATATVSNLGRLFTNVPLPTQRGRVQISDSLELIDVQGCPPVRFLTALGISLKTYAGCMTINLHYDSAVLTLSDAQSILEDMIAESIT